MGHSTASVYITKQNLGGVAPTPGTILSAAVRDWYDNEADRWADARDGAPVMYPILTELQANQLFNGDDYLVCDGKSAIFPVVAKEDFIVKTRKVRLAVDGETLARLYKSDWESRHLLHKLVVKDQGNAVHDVEIVKLPAKRKPVAVTTEGKTVTLYKVVGVNLSNGRISGQAVELATGITSQADARAKALELAASGVKSAMRGAFDAIEVRPYQQRDTGDNAVVRVTVPVPESGTVELKVTFAEPKKTATVIGWNVYFDYHQ